MNLRIDSPGKTLAFVDSLPHLYLFTCISALWNGHAKLRPLMFAASVAGASVFARWYCKKKGIRTYRIQFLIRDLISGFMDIVWSCSASLSTDPRAIFWPLLYMCWSWFVENKGKSNNPYVEPTWNHRMDQLLHKMLDWKWKQYFWDKTSFKPKTTGNRCTVTDRLYLLC